MLHEHSRLLQEKNEEKFHQHDKQLQQQQEILRQEESIETLAQQTVFIRISERV